MGYGSLLRPNACDASMKWTDVAAMSGGFVETGPERIVLCFSGLSWSCSQGFKLDSQVIQNFRLRIWVSTRLGTAEDGNFDLK